MSECLMALAVFILYAVFVIGRRTILLQGLRKTRLRLLENEDVDVVAVEIIEKHLIKAGFNVE